MPILCLPSSYSLEESKLRGGYYTPNKIAFFLVNWAIQDPNSHILEPSCGDGQFIDAIVEKFGNKPRITGIELFPMEAKKAKSRGNNKTEIIVTDAFSWFRETSAQQEFDVVVGNPPFIRYQNFPEEHRVHAFSIMKEEGLSPSKLTNAWTPFVVLATRALRTGGRLAMVLPAELLQVSYAAELRNYLVQKYDQLTIVTFRKLLFPAIQQETVLLLGIRGNTSSAKISFVELNGDLDLAKNLKYSTHKTRDLNHKSEKWTQYYLTKSELDLVRAIEKAGEFTKLGEYADVDVGIVTGNNQFFIMTEMDAKQRGLLPKCIPIVGRSNQIPGLLFTEKHYNGLLKENEKCLLLQLGDVERDKLSYKEKIYVSDGEKNSLGYKCKIRFPNWWNVPSVWAPDAFMLRQIHDGPRIVSNKGRATCTDTIHRIRMKQGVSSDSLAVYAFNSATFAFAEIRGRSYGGGVLELEPTEAENLLIPRINKNAPLAEANEMVLSGDLEKALDFIDNLVLRSVGLSKIDITKLRGIWEKMYGRRLARKRL